MLTADVTGENGSRAAITAKIDRIGFEIRTNGQIRRHNTGTHCRHKKHYHQHHHAPSGLR